MICMNTKAKKIFSRHWRTWICLRQERREMWMFWRVSRNRQSSFVMLCLCYSMQFLVMMYMQTWEGSTVLCHGDIPQLSISCCTNGERGIFLTGARFSSCPCMAWLPRNLSCSPHCCNQPCACRGENLEGWACEMSKRFGLWEPTFELVLPYARRMGVFASQGATWHWVVVIAATRLVRFLCSTGTVGFTVLHVLRRATDPFTSWSKRSWCIVLCTGNLAGLFFFYYISF